MQSTSWSLGRSSIAWSQGLLGGSTSNDSFANTSLYSWTYSGATSSNFFFFFCSKSFIATSVATFLMYHHYLGDRDDLLERGRNLCRHPLHLQTEEHGHFGTEI